MEKLNRVLNRPDYFRWIPTPETLEPSGVLEQAGNRNPRTDKAGVLEQAGNRNPRTDKPGILIFDIETDGLLNDVSKLYCLCVKDVATGEEASYWGDILLEGIARLETAPILCGHNIIGYDIPVLKKLYPGFDPAGHIFDTLNACRLIWQDIKDMDFKLARRGKSSLPPKLIGRHSLEAWGYRLGELKGDYGKRTDAFTEYSEEMKAYCVQDVRVTEKLFRKIIGAGYSPEALALEMLFQEIISEQERQGVLLDVKGAEALYADLSGERAEITAVLREAVPPKVIRETFIPKVNNKTRGYVKGVAVVKERTVIFNPGSREQAAAFLKTRYGWEPSVYTDKGEPKLDGETLSKLPYPEAKLLGHYYDITKIIGMVGEGKSAYLRNGGKDGYIHGQVITNGTATGRCSHNNPNLGQVPKGGHWGEKCRGLFIAPPGWVMVGADASGLELRTFSHYLARYDGGAYAKIVAEGDIHTENQKAAGLPTRDLAKTFIYAYLYGGGDVCLGSKKYPEASVVKQRKAGSAMRASFLRKIPAIKKLNLALQKTLEKRKELIGIDGRRIRIRSKHSALNFLLQSAGAVLVKYATVAWRDICRAKGLTAGKDYIQVLHVHDEVQAYARTREIAETVGQSFAEAMKAAGEHFKFRCPMTGEYKIGRDWGETH